MNDKELEIYNSHSWGMKKLKRRNKNGEPVYVSVCQRCGSLVPEVLDTMRECPDATALRQERPALRIV